MMKKKKLEKLRVSYEGLRKHNPPKGFGLISEETQLLVDLLDGDISGLIQQYLAGTDIGDAYLDWKMRAETTQHQIEKCAQKLAELQTHIELLKEISMQLEQ